MAINNVCQCALGKTVDFITSDVVSLGVRDYLEFKSFYSLLKIDSNIIYADTPAKEYRIGGINISDATHLSLFRNKAFSSGQRKLVIDQFPSNRALLLDEADKTYFDVAARFNYSTEGNPFLKGMEWIYPLLMEFFAQDELNKNTVYEDLYYNNMDECNKAFLKFAMSQVEPEKVARIKALPQAQLEAWQDSAVAARSFQFQKQFQIEPDKPVITPSGLKIASEARLLSEDGQVVANSKFSFGAHQCLHARLNMLKQRPDLARPGEESLVAKLRECSQPFIIEPEKQIIYSSTSKNLLDDYKQGTVVAVTGTAGAIIEKNETIHHFKEMKFITVPRHKGLFRNDKPVRLTANAPSQIQALVEYIQEARRNNQPVYICCEDDKASAAMTAALQLALKDKLPAGEMQKIDSALSPKTRADLIKRAGEPGMVTVSTGLIGRGTDIKLQGEANKLGLKVLLTYLPRERDMWQIIGRSGRLGAKGDTRLVLAKDELKRRLGKVSLKDGFYTAPETYIRQQQALMDREKQCERIIQQVVSDFSRLLTDNYFNNLLEQCDPSQHAELHVGWMKFIKEKDQLWNTIWQQIKGNMDKINPDSAVINNKLAVFQHKTQALWDDLRRDVAEVQITGGKKPGEILRKEIGELKLDVPTAKLLSGFNVKNLVAHKTILHEKYDPAHDGRAVVYAKPFERLKATLRGERKLFANFRAWRTNHGILFPNLRALWNGHMSLGEYIFGYGSSKSVDDSEQTLIPVEKVSDNLAAANESEAGQALGQPLKVEPQQTQSSPSVIQEAKPNYFPPLFGKDKEKSSDRARAESADQNNLTPPV